MKKLIVLVSILFLVVGCGVQEINAPSPESESLAKNFKKQEIYDRAIEENKDKWVNYGYKRAMRVVDEYASDIEAYEGGKYAVKSKFVTYPRVVSSNVNGRLVLETLPSEIKKNMSVSDIFDFYTKNQTKTKNMNGNPSEDSSASQNQNTLQDTSLGINTPRRPAPAKYNIQRPTQSTKYRKPNQSTIINSNKNRQISVTLPKNQKTMNAMNEYSLNCAISRNNYICDFSNKMERDYFCSETKICK